MGTVHRLFRTIEVRARWAGCTRFSYRDCKERLPTILSAHTAALYVVVALVVPLAGADQSRSRELCEYSDALANAFIPPEHRAGEFRIVLAPPDYRNRAVVQGHLVFSAIFGGVLSSDLKRSTSNRCEALVNPSVFPDLHVYLISNQRPGDAKADQSRCSQALDEAVLHLDIGEPLIKSSADAEARLRAQVISSPAGHMSYASSILTAALSRIHETDTVLSALYSVGPDQFRSIDIEAFRMWLAHQRQNGAGVTVQKICSPGTEPSDAELKASTLPHSTIVPPGKLRLSRKVSNPAIRRELKHFVIVGHDGVRNTPDVTPLVAIKEKFCNADSPPELHGGRAAEVRIRCLTSVAYDNDSWTILFCDPERCTSEDAESSITAALAKEADIVALAGNSAKHRQPRGPYLISVGTSQE